MNFLFNYSNNVLKSKPLQCLDGISMQLSDKDRTLNDYRQYESQLHLELLNACRKYMTKLGIVSIIGILDIVKQEAIELESATKGTFKKEEFETDDTEKSEINPFSRE